MATLTAYVCPVLLRRGRERLQRRRTREHRIAREQASAEVARKASDEAAAARKREIETKASVMKDLLGTVRIGPACLCARVCASLCTSKCARLKLRCCCRHGVQHDATRAATDPHRRTHACETGVRSLIRQVRIAVMTPCIKLSVNGQPALPRVGTDATVPLWR